VNYTALVENQLANSIHNLQDSSSWADRPRHRGWAVFGRRWQLRAAPLLLIWGGGCPESVVDGRVRHVCLLPRHGWCVTIF